MVYPGGKGGAGVYQQIICQIPPHRVYVEPFLGGGAVMRFLRPALYSIGIDRDAAAIAVFADGAGGIVISGEAGLRVGRGGAAHGSYLIVGDALEWLVRYPWFGDEFIYCDPPYLMEVRRSQRALYGCEFGSEVEHGRLLDVLLGLPAGVNVAVSGYASALYAEMLAGWRVVRFPAMTRGGSVAQECLWCNYAEPVALHDYRYLGGSFRERERIRRKAARWRSRLAMLPALERQALLSVLAELEHR